MAIDNEQKILSYQKYNNLNRMIDGVEKSVLDGAEKNMEDKLYYSSYIPYPYLHEPEKCLR